MTKVAETVIFLVDIQSFYASVEHAERPELRGKPLVVSGDPQRRSGVILAACPLAKKKGVQNAERLFEALQKCPEATVVKPRMQKYLDVSMQITRILEEFTDQVEPYSIDEQFMDVTASQRLFGEPEEMATQVQQRIAQDTGVYARIGIGHNKVMAKMACDNFAKASQTGRFHLHQGNLQTKLWPLPVGAAFGVGRRMERHLKRMGLRTIGALANYPLPYLKKRWGINGHVLWMTANGMDASPVVTRSHARAQKAIGHGMTLPRDYHSWQDIKVIILELCEEVCRRARASGVMGLTVSAGARGADFDAPSGFHRQQTLTEATNYTMDVYNAALDLFRTFWDRRPIRQVHISLSQLQSDQVWQLSLFQDREKQFKLGYVMDDIRDRFGPISIMRASSLTQAGQVKDRAKKIGGHYR
ncbi:DNA polymerase IV [Bacillaceae bacterium SIJ1]|uniref:DNA polymerase IV n=1 Tax=Litoribacterium kuwaitense TaxID=1398745 RepID=UPI0013EB17BD|nr:DNA polymerase IV [Litoribacterium kuwaitense]NGP44753.1 DNA polymerase IV [Litoribacterium kuwaitense]